MDASAHDAEGVHCICGAASGTTQGTAGATIQGNAVTLIDINVWFAKRFYYALRSCLQGIVHLSQNI